MITQQIMSESIRGRLPSVRCKLCHSNVKKTSHIVKLGTNYAVICSDCAEDFSPSDRDLIHNMCVAFGGYFGKLRTSKTNDYKIIKSLLKEYRITKKEGNIISLDVRILHKAFLYGISPSQIMQDLCILRD
ncbi:MAG: hypothetical protein P8Y23_16965 [Candidatus Lokiarchaeota archaeon]|jgi:hypothetical protein